MILTIKVTPNSHKNSIEGWHQNILKVKIRAAPDKGKANEELIKFLSEELKVPKNQLQIISGQTSRLKKIKIEGKVDLNLLPNSKEDLLRN